MIVYDLVKDAEIEFHNVGGTQAYVSRRINEELVKMMRERDSNVIDVRRYEKEMGSLHFGLSFNGKYQGDILFIRRT
jgi:hypothetical protein